MVDAHLGRQAADTRKQEARADATRDQVLLLPMVAALLAKDATR